MIKSPKEKAKELFNHYHNLIQDIGGDMGHEILVSILAKQSCLIAVDEIIKATTPLISTYFWLEVKEEINNL
jgi:MinD-like ATPase involved in chromosome partitioning or flagellar assembly